MIGRPQVVIDAERCMRQVESLLDQAAEDLCVIKAATPGARCAAALSEAAIELQRLSTLLTESGYTRSLPEAQTAKLRSQLSALFSRTSKVNRLLLAAAEFYRGWCAVGMCSAEPAFPYPTGQASDQWSRGPALLAFEG